MTIPPISGLPSLPSLPSLPTTAPVTAAGVAGAVTGAGAATGTGAANGFSSALGNAIDSLQQTQSTASVAEANAAAGQGSLTDTMIAATEASVQTQVASSVLDKALAAYTSIANMSF
jgi:flagellar hook-basal body complex protein FliE